MHNVTLTTARKKLAIRFETFGCHDATHRATRLVAMCAITEATAARCLDDIGESSLEARLHVKNLQGAQARRIDDKPTVR